MTIKELRRLKSGALVQWDAEPWLGRVVKSGGGCYIEWPDGQATIDMDDWALEHVHMPGAKLTNASMDSTDKSE